MSVEESDIGLGGVRVSLLGGEAARLGDSVEIVTLSTSGNLTGTGLDKVFGRIKNENIFSGKTTSRLVRNC